jgi:hypothetical protein
MLEKNGVKKNDKKRLTIAELRKMKNYENLSEDQAQEIIFSVRNLAVMFYEHLNKKIKEKDKAKKEIQKEIEVTEKTRRPDTNIVKEKKWLKNKKK